LLLKKNNWGEARFPPYTNESLAIRYPPMLIENKYPSILMKIYNLYIFKQMVWCLGVSPFLKGARG
jgi:hypothetical protein